MGEHPPDARGASTEAPLVVPVLKGKRWSSCLATYQTMFLESEIDEEHGKVWSGFISKLMDSLGYHASTGTQVIYDLERISSIEVLERGARGKLTRVKLLQPPDEQRFVDYKDGLFGGLSKSDGQARKKNSIDESLLERVNRLEETQEILIDEFNKLFARMKELENKRGELP